MQCGTVLYAVYVLKHPWYLLLDATNYPLHLSQPPGLQAVPNVTCCHWQTTTFWLSSVRSSVWSWVAPLLQTQVCLSGPVQNSLYWDRLVPNSVTGRKKNSRQLRTLKNIVSLRTVRRLKLPAMGTGDRKISHRKLYHRAKAQTGTPAP